MMCYYLNVRFQGQRVKETRTNSHMHDYAAALNTHIFRCASHKTVPRSGVPFVLQTAGNTVHARDCVS